MAMTGQGLAEARKAARPAPSQTSDPAAAAAAADAYLLADSNAIVNYIKANAELVPVTTDQGAAGAGIITGKVA